MWMIRPALFSKSGSNVFSWDFVDSFCRYPQIFHILPFHLKSLLVSFPASSSAGGRISASRRAADLVTQTVPSLINYLITYKIFNLCF